MADDSLQFQDFRDKASLLDESHRAVSKDHRDLQIEHEAANEEYNQEKQAQSPENAHFYEFEYWQGYFDVDSREVAERLVRSFLPTRRNVFGELLNAKPDFYGPFWNTATLIFLLGVSANVRTYFSLAEDMTSSRRAAKTEGKYEFEYDFQLVPVAIGLVVAYFSLIAALETFAVRCLRVSLRCRPSALASVHGYALSAFNLMALAWLLSNVWLAWLLTVLCASLSAVPLMRTLQDAFGPAQAKQQSDGQSVMNVDVSDGLEESRSWRASLTMERMRRSAVSITLVAVSVLHVGLAVCFMFLFYYR